MHIATTNATATTRNTAVPVIENHFAIGCTNGVRSDEAITAKETPTQPEAYWNDSFRWRASLAVTKSIAAPHTKMTAPCFTTILTHQ